MTFWDALILINAICVTILLGIEIYRLWIDWSNGKWQ